MSPIGDISENGILVTANVVGLYPSIPHKAGWKALETGLEKINQYYRICVQKQFFDFNGSVKQQISGTAIDTKFALTYAWYIYGSDGD